MQGVLDLKNIRLKQMGHVVDTKMKVGVYVNFGGQRMACFDKKESLGVKLESWSEYAEYVKWITMLSHGRGKENIVVKQKAWLQQTKAVGGEQKVLLEDSNGVEAEQEARSEDTECVGTQQTASFEEMQSVGVQHEAWSAETKCVKAEQKSRS
ncbi:hypothetical protein HJG60_008363 [Phyllostomus discolor]|uniref:Uncharacterized protein n=1 Tax=Phyllostomus discolor TaxID=89673 RepID=A0A833YZZ1_9CHIR|nr:hypothetical protein HJG60_008363 [Phyllostomus discolor]